MPILTRWPLPAITPEKVVLLALPTVSTASASAPVCRVPAPASEPRVWLWPLRSSVAPALTVVLLVEDSSCAVAVTRVPALTVVVPV